MVDEVHWGSEETVSVAPATNGITDCGATALMSGSETVTGSVADCRQSGYPVEQPKFPKRGRPFRFGNGKIRARAAARSNLCQLQR